MKPLVSTTLFFSHCPTTIALAVAVAQLVDVALVAVGMVVQLLQAF